MKYRRPRQIHREEAVRSRSGVYVSDISGFLHSTGWRELHKKYIDKNQGARKRPAFIGLVDFPFGIEIVKKSAFLFQLDPGVDIVDPNLIGLWQ